LEANHLSFGSFSLNGSTPNISVASGSTAEFPGYPWGTYANRGGTNSSHFALSDIGSVINIMSEPVHQSVTTKRYFTHIPQNHDLSGGAGSLRGIRPVPQSPCVYPKLIGHQHISDT